MSHGNACETSVLAQSKYCVITQCPECDIYHLHIGAMSVRLKAEVFEGICETLRSLSQNREYQNGHYSSRLHSH